MYSNQRDDGLPEDAPALAGDNWRHYLDAFKLLHDFVENENLAVPSDGAGAEGVRSVPVRDIRPAPENMLKPSGDYLCFYCDLLGFSAEMLAGGIDSLPDFYGAAYVAASRYPSVQTYLLSDSFMAFATSDQGSELIGLIESVISNWRADGLLPQSSIGCGTFVERKPAFGSIPKNFFGVQVAGTALVDAVDIHKNKPLGSRILVSPAASQKLELIPSVRMVTDLEGTLELFCERNPRSDLFDCLYYLMCLRDRQPGTRIFDHYVWSIASRAYLGGNLFLRGAMTLCDPSYERPALNTVYDAVRSVLEEYQPT